jgi:hypothetical protein
MKLRRQSNDENVVNAIEFAFEVLFEWRALSLTTHSENNDGDKEMLWRMAA